MRLLEELEKKIKEVLAESELECDIEMMISEIVHKVIPIVEKSAGITDEIEKLYKENKWDILENILFSHIRQRVSEITIHFLHTCVE